MIIYRTLRWITKTIRESIVNSVDREIEKKLKRPIQTTQSQTIEDHYIIKVPLLPNEKDIGPFVANLVNRKAIKHAPITFSVQFVSSSALLKDLLDEEEKKEKTIGFGDGDGEKKEADKTAK